MKEITAIIQPHTLSRVMHALQALPQYPGVTVVPHVHGQGRGRGAGGAFLLTEEDIAFHDKTFLIVLCDTERVEAIVSAIAQAARTGNKGDGLITVKDVLHVVRIRTFGTARQVL